MNKRTASDIIKKFSDESTRDEAVKLAEDNGYSMGIQIENGVSTLISVYDDNGSVDAVNFVEDAEPLEESVTKNATTPAPTTAKATTAKSKN